MPINQVRDSEIASRIRVLIIDDSAVFCKTVCEFLKRKQDIEIVGTATTSDEGLELARRLLPDIVLIDLNMPDRPGTDTLPLLREAAPSSGIIALTLLDRDLYRDSTVKAGADDFVSKYQLIEQLMPAIHRVHEPRSTLAL